MSYDERRSRALASKLKPRKYFACPMCGFGHTSMERVKARAYGPAVTWRKTEGGRGTGFFVDPELTVLYSELKEKDPAYWAHLQGVVRQLAEYFEVA